MKAIILIFTLLISLNIYAQKLPITGLCWGDVFTATGTTCSTDAFSAANPAYFDPAYAVTGNCLDDFRNYGPPASLATLEIDSLYGATTTSIIADVTISSDGGSSITSKGICWAKIPTLPTTANSHTNQGAGSSNFTSMATGLTPGDTVNFRPYAINSAGTAYGTTWGYIIPTECTTRPTGLTNYILVNQYHDSGDVTHYVTDFSSACTAATGLISGDYIWESTPTAQAFGIITDYTIYAGHGTDCTVIGDGWYVVSSDGAFSFVGVIQVVGGIMTLHSCEQ